MTIVDERGRLFGRINLVDAAVVIFLIALLPVGYGTYLLFRPSAPRIESVAVADLNKEEFRIASGATIATKIKVRGTGFNPLLRAHIGDQRALAFVFENPNSADILVGDMPPGTYDLILYDGVQEVARVTGAVAIKHSQGTPVRAVGRLVGLTPEQVKTLQPGYKAGDVIRGGFEVISVGPARPTHDRVRLGQGGVDVPSGSEERPAVLVIRCDGNGVDCSVGGISLSQPAPVPVTLDNGISFVIDELLPATEPTRMRAQVKFTGPQVALMQVGDRDALIDPRAATIVSIGSRDANTVTATLDLGADVSRTGWSYRGQSLRPGSTVRIITDDYEAEGVIARLDTDGAPRK
jgi:hypothetical protein